MNCPRCQRANRPDAVFCDCCGTPVGAETLNISPVASYADLRATLTAAEEQRTATSEILSVISGSPTDVQPVFDTIVRNAARLCHARFIGVYKYDGTLVHFVASHGIEPDALATLRRRYPQPPEGESLVTIAIRDGRTSCVLDFETEADTPRGSRAFALAVGGRSQVVVPLLRDGLAIGAIALLRAEAGPFPDRELTLLQTFAAQAVIAIENVRLFTETREALERQTATSEILRVISSSPTDVQPVFDTVLQRAVSLCEAQQAALWLYEGEERFRLAAAYGLRSDHLHWLKQGAHRFDRPFFRPSGPWRAGQIVDVRNTEPYRRGEPLWVRTADHEGMRTVLLVPLVKEGRLVGSIGVHRREVRRFTDVHVALLQTFADQAVIAIANARLFTELQEKNQALTQAHAQVSEALEQQTATSEILRVIASSPTDLQPVLDAVAKNAARLCEAVDAQILRVEEGFLQVVASTGPVPTVRVGQPVGISREWVTGRAVVDRQPVHVHDLATASEVDFPMGTAYAKEFGHRTTLAIPLLREDASIGAILIRRTEVRPFTDAQIALVETFADQAVIAIENVRLFSETQEALERQTATSEILRVISRSPTDAQPVFDAVAANAAQLCQAQFCHVFRFDGTLLYLAAHYGLSPEGVAALQSIYPSPPGRGSAAGRSILSGGIEQIPDINADADYRHSRIAAMMNYQSIVAVPMHRGGRPIGCIVAGRSNTGYVSERLVNLLQTFAEQAVIAVENVRLFRELQERTRELTQSVEKLTALGQVSQAVSSTLDLERVLDTITERARQLAGADGAAIYEYDEVSEQFHLRATRNVDTALIQALRTAPLRKGEGVMGHATEIREPVQIGDIAAPGVYKSHLRDVLMGAGYRALLSVPIVREGQIIGSLSLSRKAPGEFPSQVIDVLQAFATQSALAIQNARLFREIADKSRQLEVASQHKSEFLANMSHELRTPLNAIIGFSEVLSERMFGELNEKQDEYLKDIHASGQHLLSLINDILDLSKIEAGRMELELTDFDLPAAIDNALTLVRERAGRHGIALRHAVDARLGPIRGDERKLKQVLLNLLSNAIKFTPEAGRIDVRAGLADGMAEVSVMDTGVGIAPEDHEAVFEEFRQVGTGDKKVEGTGLGLTLSRKFVELHGGRIWVKSQVGVGSTFTFTIPVRRIE